MTIDQEPVVVPGVSRGHYLINVLTGIVKLNL
jgi:hypothetical protein